LGGVVSSQELIAKKKPSIVSFFMTTKPVMKQRQSDAHKLVEHPMQKLGGDLFLLGGGRFNIFEGLAELMHLSSQVG
jgi:hypothetical protein